MTSIQTVAVIGSGVMGAGIAAHAANAGCRVLLLDIVPKDGENRNALAEKAVARLLAASPSGFTHPDNAKRVTCGNLEDHLPQLSSADWIIEAVIERLDIKRDVYRKIAAHRRAGAVVSSNTSTIPLHELVEGMDEEFRAHFMIAHFFNPPRFMRLLEVVRGPEMAAETFARVVEFSDRALGKQAVRCKDTPGFIANRIGVFWMFAGLKEALSRGIGVEEADALLSKPAGLPGTGLFGLFDLIGLDLMPLIAKEMLDSLPETDAFHGVYREDAPHIALLRRLIAEGYTGRKGKGGFYRVSKQADGKKTKEILDLKTGEYRAETPVSLESARAKNLADLVGGDDAGSEFAWAVLSQALVYAASLVPEISDHVGDVDEAMRSGYSWKNGPFEMIDAIGAGVFAARLRAEARAVPSLLEKAEREGKFYTFSGPKRLSLTLGGTYEEMKRAPGHLWLGDIKRERGAPVVENASAALWDMGEGVACLELTSKMGAVDMNILALLSELPERVARDFRALVIGSDAPQFSVGANLNVFLEHARAEEWQQVSDIIRRGQAALLALKYARFPVVAAVSGLALGGGCEVALHADAVQAHIEAYPGLVEPKVGLIPAWGGCKEMLTRHDAALAPFEFIVTAKTASSAEDAVEMGIVAQPGNITFNRARLLADAKSRALSLAADYAPPAPPVIKCGGAPARQAMLDRLSALAEEGTATPHDLVIGRALSHVLSGGGEAGNVSEQALLELEHDAFMELIRTEATQARIAHMLKTGKPLRN